MDEKNLKMDEKNFNPKRDIHDRVPHELEYDPSFTPGIDLGGPMLGEEICVYTQRQMLEMLSRTRSWVLNNPSGGLPYLPVIWAEHVPYEDNMRAMFETLPPYKEPHWLIKLLMKLGL